MLTLICTVLAIMLGVYLIRLSFDLFSFGLRILFYGALALFIVPAFFGLIF